MPLSQFALTIEAVKHVAVDGEEFNLFDHGRSGHHPPAAIRADHVIQLLDMLIGGNSWSTAAKAVCDSSTGLGTSTKVVTFPKTELKTLVCRV